MHYAFILKCKYPDNRISHFVWQRSGSSRKEVEKEFRKDFDKTNVFGTGMKIDPKNNAELLEMIEAGECSEDIEETQKLFDTAAKKALKLDGKSNEQGKIQTPTS